MWTVDFSPLVSTFVFVGIALVFGALLLFLWRTGRNVVLRALVVVALLVALADPRLIFDEQHRLDNIVLVVVDRSASQTLDGRDKQQDIALEQLTANLKQIRHLDVQILETTQGRDFLSSAETIAFKPIQDAMRSIPADRVAGIILITDGQIHDIPASLVNLGLEVPLHALVTGYQNEKDRQVVIVKAPRFGLLGKDQTIEFRVEETGFPDQDISLTAEIEVDGKAFTSLRITQNDTYSITVPVTHSGDNYISISVPVDDTEISPINNTAVFSIEGVRDTLRVLLVSGEPHAGERSWRNMLKSDPSVDLVHFTILRPPDKQDATPIGELSLIAFPARELFSEKIDEFDLIISDRYRRRDVLPLFYFDSIARYVERGGALLLAAGPEYAEKKGSIYQTALSTIVPAVPTGKLLTGLFRPALTKKGQRHPITSALVASAPDWGRWLRQVEATVENGDVIMSGLNDAPLLAVSHVGKGRVATLLSDHSWLWQRGFDGGGPQNELFRRLAHWLMQEPDLEEEAIQTKLESGQLVITRQTLNDRIDDIELTAPDGSRKNLKPELVSPGKHQASTPVNTIGLFRISSGSLNHLVHIGPQNTPEFSDLASTTLKLADLAGLSGGSVRRLQESKSTPIRLPRIIAKQSGLNFSGKDWIGLKTPVITASSGSRAWHIFNNGFGLALLLGLLCFTWLRER
ncbi:MAG: hypothetical protein JKY10_07140 [Cohaesibacteraceae bacterium]|nr:hypothetical protein [Cohaesibacteraceae bacterium]